MPTLSYITLLLLVTSFAHPVAAQGASTPAPDALAAPVALSAQVVPITLGADDTLLITFVLSYNAEAGIQYIASDSVRTQLITHPKSDLQVVDGSLRVTCQGLHSHEVRASGPVRLAGGRLGSRTQREMAMLTAQIHNPNEQVVEVRYEPFGDTNRVMIVSADVTNASSQE